MEGLRTDNGLRAGTRYDLYGQRDTRLRRALGSCAIEEKPIRGLRAKCTIGLNERQPDLLDHFDHGGRLLKRRPP